MLRAFRLSFLLSRIRYSLVHLQAHNLIDKALLRERLDLEILQRATVIPSADMARKKEVRIRTRILFRLFILRAPQDTQSLTRAQVHAEQIQLAP